MVKVEGLTEEETALRDKKSKLVELTKIICKGSKIIISSTSFAICFDDSESPQVYVSPAANRVVVNDEAYFHRAYQLAAFYEWDFPEPEFTVKTDYK